MAVTVYKSTDVGAPTLSGTAGDLVRLLKACLVDGYGTAATGTVTSNNTNAANNDTVTVNGRVYTCKTVLTGAADEIFIGATADLTLGNLVKAINLTGVAGTDYGAGTTINDHVSAGAVAAHATTLTARLTGTVGNALTLATTSATYTVSGATLTGGANTKSAAGWSNPYSNTALNTAQARVFRGGSGIQQYFQIEDNSPGTAAAKHAQMTGFETMSAYNTGTGQFPTAAQRTAQGVGPNIRKSATADATTRPWIVIADDRTCWIFAKTADTNAANWFGACFGEFYSLVAADGYRSVVEGQRDAAAAVGGANDGVESLSTNAATNAPSNGNMTMAFARSYTGLGGSYTTISRWGDVARSGAATSIGNGGLPLPEVVSGGVHVAPVHFSETTTLVVRGRARGFFQICHPSAGFSADLGDTITGSGAYAGRTFQVIKQAPSGGVFCIDITGPWETN